MEVKYWTRAGLMLTDWCNAACACCYANCGPGRRQWLSAEGAMKIWQSLINASPHGCRIHLTGGEPFGDFSLLLEICRLGRQRGLGPLESVETNGYWAENDDQIYAHLHALDEQGLGRLQISADPYHQQFVPIERPRRLAEVARQVLGEARVRVRWEDWLAGGSNVSASGCECGTAAPGCAEFRENRTAEGDRATPLLELYAAAGRDRLTGRAADKLAGLLPTRPAEAFDGDGCAGPLLRGRHVHISPTGEVWPATCVGITVGNALEEDVSEIWRRLSDSWRQMSVVGPLSQRGPMGLMDAAVQSGFVGRPGGYATKCQLCFDLRRHLLQRRVTPWWHELAPASLYEPDVAGGAAPPGA